MAHAYYHAKSSARRFGGVLDDYLYVHAWMDHTKMHLADARHRLFLHNAWGIFLAETVLGTTIHRASDGKEVPTRTVLEQHVKEDFSGKIPTLEECFAQLAAEPLLDKDDIAWHCQQSVRRWGGSASSYRPLHERMNQARTVLPDSRHQRLLHNAWGISILCELPAATHFSLSLDTVCPSSEQMKDRPTARAVLESHVLDDIGHIPTLAESVQGIELRPWMYKNAQSLSQVKVLEEVS